MNMELENCLWVMPMCTIVTVLLALTVITLGLCWWRIFRLTVHRFNKEDRRRD